MLNSALLFILFPFSRFIYFMIYSSPLHFLYPFVSLSLLSASLILTHLLFIPFIMLIPFFCVPSLHASFAVSSIDLYFSSSSIFPFFYYVIFPLFQSLLTSLLICLPCIFFILPTNCTLLWQYLLPTSLFNFSLYCLFSWHLFFLFHPFPTSCDLFFPFKPPFVFLSSFPTPL